jgi:glycosyltransferase involved in cell wall biosynthesis
MPRRSREPISVIMPAYNAQKYVRRSVASVLSNLKPHDEMIILDDASEIPVEIILNKSHSQRITIIRNKVNLGVAESLNILLSHAKHNLVARMDADDIMLRNRLSFQAQCFEKDLNLVLNFTSVLNFGSKVKNFIPASMKKILPNEFRYCLLLGNPVAHSSAMFRKDIITGIGGYKSSPAEDYELWMRLAINKANTTKIRVPGVLYRKHSQQVTRSKQWQELMVSSHELEKTHLTLARSLGWKSESVWSQMITKGVKNPSDENFKRFVKFALEGKKSRCEDV